MRFYSRYISVFLVWLFSQSIFSQQSSSEPPRLVVGIVIDGLQQKHLEELWNYLDPNGFKQLMDRGAVFPNVAYNITSSGRISDIASVMTGSVPFYNGISGDDYFDKNSRQLISVLQDDNQAGIGTDKTYSAHNLLSGTFSDELMLAHPGKSKSFAIGIYPGDVIMLGGHTANSVAWIDNQKMRWVTTGYYTAGLSKWADGMNTDGSFANYVSRKWGPLYGINTYLTKPLRTDRKWGFYYDPSDKIARNSPVSILRNTPSANGLVTELALRTIEGEQLGKNSSPDVLMLEYTVRTPFERTFSLQSAEKEDMYYRLDKDLQNLLHRIDVEIGLDKTLIVVFANQTGVHSPLELGDNKIPAGYFNARRSMALLSSYLMAIYGQERWIDGYYNKNIFLNRQKIEEKKINLRQMQQTVADFMTEFEGIQNAYTASTVLNMSGENNSELVRLRNSYNKKSVGDVIITLQPGWLELDDRNHPVGESNEIVSYTPVYFYGWKIKPQKVENQYETTDIAATIAKILNIPPPNACIGKPMVEITHNP